MFKGQPLLLPHHKKTTENKMDAGPNLFLTKQMV